MTLHFLNLFVVLRYFEILHLNFSQLQLDLFVNFGIVPEVPNTPALPFYVELTPTTIRSLSRYIDTRISVNLKSIDSRTIDLSSHISALQNVHQSRPPRSHSRPSLVGIPGSNSRHIHSKRRSTSRQVVCCGNCFWIITKTRVHLPPNQ